MARPAVQWLPEFDTALPVLSVHADDEPAGLASAFVRKHEALFKLGKPVKYGGGWRQVEVLEGKIIRFH
jgi:hypothetical protein